MDPAMIEVSNHVPLQSTAPVNTSTYQSQLPHLRPNYHVQMQHHPLAHQQHYNPNFRPPIGLQPPPGHILPGVSIPPNGHIRPGTMIGPNGQFLQGPPPSFNIPPPPVQNTGFNMAGQNNFPINSSNNPYQHNQIPMGYPTNIPPIHTGHHMVHRGGHLNPQHNPSLNQMNNIQQSQHSGILFDDFDNDEDLAVNDDAAYDFDDENNDNNLNGTDDDNADDDGGDFNNKKRKNHSKRRRNHRKNDIDNYEYDQNYDLELVDNIDDIIDRPSSGKGSGNVSSKHKKHKDDKKKSSNRRHKHRSSKKSSNKKRNTQSSDDDNEEGEGGEEEEEEEETPIDLVSIKTMLKNILDTHIKNIKDDDEFDDDVLDALNNIREQIVEDDGSLTFEECTQMHLTIQTLLGAPEDGEEDDNNQVTNDDNLNETNPSNESDTFNDEDDDDNEDDQCEIDLKQKKRKFQKNYARKSLTAETSHDDELKPSKKKRKDDINISHHQYNETKNLLKNKKIAKGSQSNSTNHRKLNEIEAGEIDDIYDDTYTVEKEFEDLLNDNTNTNHHISHNHNIMMNNSNNNNYHGINNNIRY
jgi:hypothetical protein